MANHTAQIMPYADNATIITALTGCDQIVNITQTIEDLYNLYRDNISNPVASQFSNISITDFNCNISSGKYFQQIIAFTRPASIRIQIALASVYYDYINTYSYSLNGFHIDPEGLFTLSSITLNDTAQSDACSSAEVAQDIFCPLNSTTPVCVNTYTNPWIFNCSINTTTSTISSLSTTDDNRFLSTTLSPVLSPWQIGLVCGLGILFLLFFLLILGYFLRRHLRSKRITFSRENLCDNMKSMQKSGIPHGQAFQRTTTIVQPKQINHKNIPWIHETIVKKNDTHIKPNGTFITHTKVHNPVLPKKITKPTYIPNNHPNTITPKAYQTTATARTISGTSINQLKSITSVLEEDTLDDLDIISLDRSNLTSPKKPSTPVSRANISSFDESLHDEDAWMSILAVANAELDVLNRLENEQLRKNTE